MYITTRSTRHLKQQNILFVLLFLSIMGLLAFLSNHYVYLNDWTSNNQNSLNEISLKLLKTMDAPIKITSYTNNIRVKQAINELISRYKRFKPDITLTFIDPNSDPEKTRALKITVDGEMVINYQGRQENLTELSEQNLTNIFYRLLRAKERKIVFIQGHGERSPIRQANFDLSSFTKHLNKQGFHLDTLNLTNKRFIPENISVLVLAGPQAAFLPDEVLLLVEYIKSGGNFLWLGEPLKISHSHPMHGLLPLSELLGIEFPDGVVVDPTASQHNIKRSDYSTVTEYPEHPINHGFSTITLFPQAAGIERLPAFLNSENEKTNSDTLLDQSSSHAFNMTPFLMTDERSWIETSPFNEKSHFSDLLDIIGPITIGMVLTRDRSNKEQRIVVLGDGDFLSNTFLGNAGNLTLGINIFNWLSHDEQFIAIPTRVKNDILLEMSPTMLFTLGIFFLVILPALLITTGSIIWFKRRNR